MSEQVYTYLSKAMGFTYDSSLPANCLHSECFTEQLIKATFEYLTTETNWM